MRRSRAGSCASARAHAVARLVAARRADPATVGSLGTSTAGSVALSIESRLASGDVDSMVLIRTIVRSRRASSDADALGQIGQRRLGAELAAQLLARRFEFAAHAAHATRPGVAAQGVDHGAANAAFGEGLELDAPRLVEPVRRIDQAEHAVLDEVAQVDRMRHRRRHAPCERLHEWQARLDSILLMILPRAPAAFDVPPRARMCRGTSSSGNSGAKSETAVRLTIGVGATVLR